MTAPYSRTTGEGEIVQNRKRIRSLEALGNVKYYQWAPIASIEAYGFGATQPTGTTVTMEMWQVGPVCHTWITAFFGGGVPGASGGWKIIWDEFDIFGATTPRPGQGAGPIVTGVTTQDASGLMTPTWGSWGTLLERAIYLWWGGGTPGSWTPISPGSPYVWANQDLIFGCQGQFVAYPIIPTPFP